MITIPRPPLSNYLDALPPPLHCPCTVGAPNRMGSSARMLSHSAQLCPKVYLLHPLCVHLLPPVDPIYDDFHPRLACPAVLLYRALLLFVHDYP
jgi:hypothetical protein